MGFMDYKKIRILTLFIAAFFPMFFMTLGLALGFNWLGGAAIGLMITIIVIFVSNNVLSNNSWIKAIDKEGILLFDLNSSGVIPMAVARLKTNKFGQKLFAFNQGNEEVSRLYDREVAWTLQSPLDGTYEIYRNKETGKKRILIDISEETHTKSVWFSDYLSVLFFNSQKGNFLTKNEMCKNEKEDMITYLTLNEQRELRELNATLTFFMRDYADRLSAVAKGMLNNNGFKILIIIIVVIGIFAAVYFFVPGVPQMLGGAAPAAVQQVSNGAPVSGVVKP